MSLGYKPPKGVYIQDKIEGSKGKHDVVKGEALNNIMCPFNLYTEVTKS
jgi:hypothetical protein